ncbi:MAG: hypothetical protein JXR46_13200 [Calditrichaceae bacterium]|nr:hypothetical protein [Calditrichaceae bacterium]MBN2709992.1 hypothetical protein [Calditrichaceae bacterium]RQV97330.1 MAG: hypothetical protein EH224_01940 [Calditrichota bacterium]
MDDKCFFRTDKLVIWRPEGSMTLEKIEKFIEFLNTNSGKRDPHFDRFVDLSCITEIAVSYEQLSTIAFTRKTYSQQKLDKKIRMVFYVNNSISYGMTRMYQNLFDDKYYDIKIFKNLCEAAAFLEVDASLLK